MEHHVGFVHQFREQLLVLIESKTSGNADHFECRIFSTLPVERSSRTNTSSPRSSNRFRQMRTDKSGSAGDQITQCAL